MTHRDEAIRQVAEAFDGISVAVVRERLAGKGWNAAYDTHTRFAVDKAEECLALRGALREAIRTLEFLPKVNMQKRDDGAKLRELAECRIDAIRVLPLLRAALLNQIDKEQG